MPPVGNFGRGKISLLNVVAVGFLVISLAAVTYSTSSSAQIFFSQAKKGVSNAEQKIKDRAQNFQNSVDSKIRRAERESDQGGAFCAGGAACNSAAIIQEYKDHINDSAYLDKLPQAQKDIIEAYKSGVEKASSATDADSAAKELESLKSISEVLYNQAAQDANQQRISAEQPAQDAQMAKLLSDCNAANTHGQFLCNIPSGLQDFAHMQQLEAKSLLDRIYNNSELHYSDQEISQFLSTLRQYSNSGYVDPTLVANAEKYTKALKDISGIDTATAKLSEAKAAYEKALLLGTYEYDVNKMIDAQREISALLTELKSYSDQGVIDPGAYKLISQRFVTQEEYDKCSQGGTKICEQAGALKELTSSGSVAVEKTDEGFERTYYAIVRDTSGNFIDYRSGPEPDLQVGRELVLTAVNRSGTKEGQDALVKIKDLYPDLVDITEAAIRKRGNDSVFFNTNVAYTQTDINRVTCMLDKDCFGMLAPEPGFLDLSPTRQKYTDVVDFLTLGNLSDVSRYSQLYGSESPEALTSIAKTAGIAGVEAVSLVVGPGWALEPLTGALTAAKVFTTLSRAGFVLQLGVAASAQIDEPGSQYAWEQTGLAAMSGATLGTSSLVTKAISLGNPNFLLAARALNTVSTVANFGVDVPYAITACSEKVGANCILNAVAVVGDIAGGAGDFLNGTLLITRAANGVNIPRVNVPDANTPRVNTGGVGDVEAPGVVQVTAPDGTRMPLDQFVTSNEGLSEALRPVNSASDALQGPRLPDAPRLADATEVVAEGPSGQLIPPSARLPEAPSTANAALEPIVIPPGRLAAPDTDAIVPEVPSSKPVEISVDGNGTIGNFSSDNLDSPIKDRGVSRNHLSVEAGGPGQAFITHNQGHNGAPTFLNGKKITPGTKASIKVGDTIEISQTRLKVASIDSSGHPVFDVLVIERKPYIWETLLTGNKRTVNLTNLPEQNLTFHPGDVVENLDYLTLTIPPKLTPSGEQVYYRILTGPGHAVATHPIPIQDTNIFPTIRNSYDVEFGILENGRFVTSPGFPPIHVNSGVASIITSGQSSLVQSVWGKLVVAWNSLRNTTSTTQYTLTPNKGSFDIAVKKPSPITQFWQKHIFSDGEIFPSARKIPENTPKELAETSPYYTPKKEAQDALEFFETNYADGDPRFLPYTAGLHADVIRFEFDGRTYMIKFNFTIDNYVGSTIQGQNLVLEHGLGENVAPTTFLKDSKGKAVGIQRFIEGQTFFNTISPQAIQAKKLLMDAGLYVTDPKYNIIFSSRGPIIIDQEGIGLLSEAKLAVAKQPELAGYFRDWFTLDEALEYARTNPVTSGQNATGVQANRPSSIVPSQRGGAINLTRLFNLQDETSLASRFARTVIRDDLGFFPWVRDIRKIIDPTYNPYALETVTQVAGNHFLREYQDFRLLVDPNTKAVSISTGLNQVEIKIGTETLPPSTTRVVSPGQELIINGDTVRFVGLENDVPKFERIITPLPPRQPTALEMWLSEKVAAPFQRFTNNFLGRSPDTFTGGAVSETGPQAPETAPRVAGQSPTTTAGTSLQQRLFGEPKVIKINKNSSGFITLRPGDTVVWDGRTIRIPDPTRTNVEIYWQEIGRNQSPPQRLTPEGVRVNLSESPIIQFGPLENGSLSTSPEVSRLFGNNTNNPTQIVLQAGIPDPAVITRLNPQAGIWQRLPTTARGAVIVATPVLACLSGTQQCFGIVSGIFQNLFGSPQTTTPQQTIPAVEAPVTVPEVPAGPSSTEPESAAPGINDPNISQNGVDVSAASAPSSERLAIFLSETINEYAALVETNPQKIIDTILSVYPGTRVSVYQPGTNATQANKDTFALYIAAMVELSPYKGQLNGDAAKFIKPGEVFASWYGYQQDGKPQATQCAVWQNLIDKAFPELNIADIQGYNIENASEVFNKLLRNNQPYSEIQGGGGIQYLTRKNVGDIQVFGFDNLNLVYKGDTFVYGNHMGIILDKYLSDGKVYFLISEANSPKGNLDGLPRTYLVDEQGFKNTVGNLNDVVFLRSTTAFLDESLKSTKEVPDEFRGVQVPIPPKEGSSLDNPPQPVLDTSRINARATVGAGQVNKPGFFESIGNWFQQKIANPVSNLFGGNSTTAQPEVVRRVGTEILVTDQSGNYSAPTLIESGSRIRKVQFGSEITDPQFSSPSLENPYTAIPDWFYTDLLPNLDLSCTTQEQCLQLFTALPLADGNGDLQLMLDQGYVPEGLVSLSGKGVALRNQNILVRASAAERIIAFLNELKANGYDVMITDGYRSYADQTAINSENPQAAASPGMSMHQAGVAFDLFRITKGELNLDKPLPKYQQILDIAHKYGIVHPFSWDADPAHWVVLDAVYPGLTQELIDEGINVDDKNILKDVFLGMAQTYEYQMGTTDSSATPLTEGGSQPGTPPITAGDGTAGGSDSEKFTYYSQYDERWAKVGMAGGDCLIENKGCTLMVAAMATNMDPLQLRKEINIYYGYNENAEPPQIPCSGASVENYRPFLTSEGYNIIRIDTNHGMNSVKSEIGRYTSQGNPVWLDASIWMYDAKKGKSAWVPHAVLAVGIDTNGNILINDPVGNSSTSEYISLPDNEILEDSLTANAIVQIK